jgi:hypothetical protein
MKNEYDEILMVINEYVNLQESLVNSFKEKFKFKDWSLLTDVPKSGVFEFNNQNWKFQKHGTGICFTYENYYVDMNRNLEDKSTAFDVYRIVDYMEHMEKKRIKYGAEILVVCYETFKNVFKQIEKLGLIKRRKELDGEIYEIIN